MDMRRLWAVSSRGFALIATLALADCGNKQVAPANPDPAVGVITVQLEAVVLTTELPGRTVPNRLAEVRARVDGIVLKRRFNEGTVVRSGQRLYQIDPALYQAVFASAKAGLAKARAKQVASQALAELVRRWLPQMP